MRKTLFILILAAAALLLAACSGNGNQTNLLQETDADSNAGGGNSSIDSETSSSDNSPATCTAQSQELPDLAREDDHITGEKEDYAITIINYNDFSCEGCANMAATLAKAVELYPEDIRLIFRYFPILGAENDNGIVAAKAAEAAGLQGKFWEMHSILYSTIDEWKDLDPEGFSDFIWVRVNALGLDLEQFDADVNSEAISQKIAQQYDEALGYSDTPPVVLVNGSVTPPYLNTVGDFFVWLETLMIPYGRHINSLQFSECPPMTVDPDAEYTATLHTERGDILLALYPDIAPMAVNSFIFLAENDYYDNTPFYAVIEGFVAQAGDPSGTGWGTPGYLFGMETSPDLTFERPYMVAMANAGPDANNSQFFITLSPLTYLNGKHTIFGEVIDGVDVLKSLSFRDPEQDPLAPINEMLLDITIEKQ